MAKDLISSLKGKGFENEFIEAFTSFCCKVTWEIGGFVGLTSKNFLNGITYKYLEPDEKQIDKFIDWWKTNASK